MAEPELTPEDLVGLTVDDAFEIVRPAGYTIRVIRVDGRYTIVTRDYKPNRLNVEVVAGKIHTVTSFG